MHHISPIDGVTLFSRRREASRALDQALPILTLRLLLVCGLSINSFFTTKAQGEWYVGAYGGVASPGAFSNATLSDATLGGGVSGARVVDLELETSGVFGAKVGYFLEAYPWLGFETEAYTLKPDVKQQTIVGGTTSGRVFADTLPKPHCGSRLGLSISSSARRPSASGFTPMPEWGTDYSLLPAQRVENLTSISIMD